MLSIGDREKAMKSFERQGLPFVLTVGRCSWETGTAIAARQGHIGTPSFDTVRYAPADLLLDHLRYMDDILQPSQPVTNAAQGESLVGREDQPEDALVCYEHQEIMSGLVAWVTSLRTSGVPFPETVRDELAQLQIQYPWRNVNAWSDWDP